MDRSIFCLSFCFLDVVKCNYFMFPVLVHHGIRLILFLPFFSLQCLTLVQTSITNVKRTHFFTIKCFLLFSYWYYFLFISTKIYQNKYMLQIYIPNGWSNFYKPFFSFNGVVQYNAWFLFCFFFIQKGSSVLCYNTLLSQTRQLNKFLINSNLCITLEN